MSMLQLGQAMGDYLDRFWVGLVVGLGWGAAPWVYIFLNGYSWHQFGRMLCLY